MSSSDTLELESVREILDLLALAPSSFAALFRFVTQPHERSGSTAQVRDVLDLLLQLAKMGLLRVGLMTDEGLIFEAGEDEIDSAARRYECWLNGKRELSVDDVSFDEVGLWFELTEAGRQNVLRSMHNSETLWMLDEVGDQKRVYVSASDLTVAQEKLGEWATERGVRLVGPQEVRTGHVFRLRSGAEASGVLLSAQFEERDDEEGD